MPIDNTPCLNAIHTLKSYITACFNKCYDKEKNLIKWIKANKIKILNSGIKMA